MIIVVVGASHGVASQVVRDSPVGCVAIEVLVQVDETAGYFDRVAFGFVQAGQQPGVELPDFLDVAKEDVQFVHLEAGALLPILQVAGNEKKYKKVFLFCL